MKKLFAITLGFICLLAMTSVAHTRQPQSKENSVVACKSCHTIIPDYAYVIGDGDATEAVSYAYQPALTGDGDETSSVIAYKNGKLVAGDLQTAFVPIGDGEEEPVTAYSQRSHRSRNLASLHKSKLLNTTLYRYDWKGYQYRC